jgi:hypothetical protein
MRVALLGIVSLLLGCERSVVELDGSDGAGGSVGIGDPSSTTSSAGDAGGAGSVATHPPGRTYSSVYCHDDGVQLFVEIWPETAVFADCMAEAGIGDVLVLGILSWDGQPGTFVVGQETPAGTAGAGWTSYPIEAGQGTITVEPFTDTPGWISWDLDTHAGRTDLSVCGHFPQFPCPR